MEKDQRIRDPIHNLIKFQAGHEDDHVLWRLVQSAPVQRLRRIKQLGFSDFVYPGATHTRFSHVVGAMQMARRMISVLERNRQLNVDSAEHKIMRRATLCAALLHDVGHGPYSHVFEEVSRSVGVKIHHEEFTRRIIASEAIRRILEESDPGLTEKVLSFFSQESGSSAYFTIVSSQMDADRLDFLARDRYFTGVRFADIDLEWLFDTLTVQKIPVEVGSDAEEFTFIVKDKGLSTAENFLSAYSQMYSKVYFHKTTRAVQFLFSEYLAEAYGTSKALAAMPDFDPLKRYFSKAPSPDIDSFLELDDSSVTQSIAWARVNASGRLLHLAKRIASRDLFKCYEVPKRPKEAPPRERLHKFILELKKSKIWYRQDTLQEKGYKQFAFHSDDYLQNILVYSEFDREPQPILTLAPQVEQFVDKTPVRLYFESSEDRAKAVAIWDSV
jgi:uncharacterized protein